MAPEPSAWGPRQGRVPTSLATQNSSLQLFLRQNTFSLPRLVHPQAGAALDRALLIQDLYLLSSKGPPNSRSGKTLPLPQGHKINQPAAENEDQRNSAVSGVRIWTGQNSKQAAFNRHASEGQVHSRFSTSIFRPDNRARLGGSLAGLNILIGIRDIS